MFVWVCIFVCASVARAAEHAKTGEPHEVPVNSTRVVTAARFAVAEFNRANAEDEFAYKIRKITSAKMQVVAGINYILKVHLGRTMCKTSDTTDSGPCVYHSEPKELQCDFIITEIPWEGSFALIQTNCHLNNC